MKYKSDMDIWWSDGSLYKSHNGIVECPHELPHPFIKLEEMKKAKPVIEEEIVINEKDILVNIAHDLGLGSPSTLKRLSIDTLNERIEEAK
jgi:hypothetical protein